MCTNLCLTAPGTWRHYGHLVLVHTRTQWGKTTICVHYLHNIQIALSFATCSGCQCNVSDSLIGESLDKFIKEVTRGKLLLLHKKKPKAGHSNSRLNFKKWITPAERAIVFCQQGAFPIVKRQWSVLLIIAGSNNPGKTWQPGCTQIAQPASPYMYWNSSGSYWTGEISMHV